MRIGLFWEPPPYFMSALPHNHSGPQHDTGAQNGEDAERGNRYQLLPN